MGDGSPPEEALEGPVCHHEKTSEVIPLVWVGDVAPPSSEWVRRVAGHGGAEPTSPSEVSRTSGAFGARQRGWLTRLTWEPSPALERMLVRSSSFVDGARLAELATQMPVDAVAVPAQADCVVDGLTPMGEVMFYALFEGPEPWTSVPLMPVPPPFSGLESPLLLGEVEVRLNQWAASLDEAALDATALELVREAMKVVSSDMR